VRNELQELFRYRELILILVRRELRIRYKNSALGFAWSLIPLILQVLVLSFVVKYIYGAGPRDISAYILCAYLPWNFFQNGLLDGSSSVLAQYSLLKKVYFPREILPIASTLANAIHLLLALGVFFVYRYVFTPLVYGWPGPPPLEILWLPVIIVIDFLLVLGIVFFLSTWNVFDEDVKFITQSFLNLAFFALPIAWFTEKLFYAEGIARLRPGLGHVLTIAYNANPVSWLISAYRQTLLPQAILDYHRSPSGGMVGVLTAHFDYRYFLLAILTSTLTAFAGYAYFNRRKWAFVERP
jgi:lipopolysaccharide transport system permease protein